MKETNLEEVGYVTYFGTDVAEGIIDAASAGSALLGLDEALRFFNSQQSKQLASIDYQIPIRTQKGSWEAVILAAGVAGLSTFALSYLKKAGEKMAENDFKDVGMKDIFKKSLEGIQYFIKLVKATKRNGEWNNPRLVIENNSPFVEITSHDGQKIRIPREFYEWYQDIPRHLLVKLTTSIRKDRSLSISVNESGRRVSETVTFEEKSLFEAYVTEDTDDTYLFPEMRHGDNVRLEGRLIRANASSNSLGIEYKDHHLNCHPETGSVRRFKSALFLRCIVEGTVSRHIKKSVIADRRPTILIRNITPIEDDPQISLISD